MVTDIQFKLKNTKLKAKRVRKREKASLRLVWGLEDISQPRESSAPASARGSQGLRTSESLQVVDVPLCLYLVLTARGTGPSKAVRDDAIAPTQ